MLSEENLNNLRYIDYWKRPCKEWGVDTWDLYFKETTNDESSRSSHRALGKELNILFKNLQIKRNVKEKWKLLKVKRKLLQISGGKKKEDKENVEQPARTVPAKRELEVEEFPLDLPKKQKFGFAVDSVSDFKELRRLNLFYADKTMYIERIENNRFVLMFLRPKRFGKSLLLSTLKYFYDINEAPYFRSLFGSLDIYKHASELSHNKFLILKWDFSKIQSSSNLEEMNKNLKDHINMSIEKFCDDYARLLNITKKSDYLQKRVINSDNCINSLERLFLKFRNYKIYVLIDEYDAFANEYLDEKDSYAQLHEKHSLYKAIFATLKAHRGIEIERIFITGVSPLSINELTSFNISHDISLDRDFWCLCGLEKKDIQEALGSIFEKKEHITFNGRLIPFIQKGKERLIEFHLKKISDNYYGYNFCHTKEDNGIYCTKLSLDYLQHLLDDKPMGHVKSDNDLNDSVLRFIEKNPNLRLLFSELLVTRQTSYNIIEENFRLFDLNDAVNQNPEFLKSFLFYFGGLTFEKKSQHLCVPNVTIMKTIIHRIINLCNIDTNSQDFKHAVNNLIHHHKIDTLCSYLQLKLKEWIKRGNLKDDRELVTKVMFHVSLSAIPNYLNDTEVPIVIYGHKMEANICYADLLIVETRPVSDGAKKSRFIFEFKCKGVNFLDLQIKGDNSDWEVMEKRADKVETMSASDVRQLKCGNAERFEIGKTMEDILNDGCEQLIKYVLNLEEDDRQNHREFATSAFVVMTVGSRKLIWEKLASNSC
ncbi:15029_t:CDS:2 [Funneliformis caledonium]|uniref:15029_t:CDS:1 n=1 Tax=Funneliformis caledonium TaxID=1117310 RepID=A0A9N9EVB6_9GLOM|nr:15029_t:CDS:2 [Funneliformis caledonium]